MNIGQIQLVPIPSPASSHKNLKNNRNDNLADGILKGKSQNKLSDTFINLTADMTKFIEKIKFSNTQYALLTPQELKNPSKLSVFLRRKKEESSSQKDLINRVNICSKRLNDDITVLEKQSMNWQMEVESSKEAIVGYDSYLGGVVYQRYGMNHRLGQIEAEMKNRQNQLLKEAAAIKESSLNTPIILFEKSEEAKKTMDLLIQLSQLKEKLLITNAALIKIQSSELGKTFSVSHFKDFKALEREVKLYAVQKEKKLKSIEDQINYESDFTRRQELQEEKKTITEGYAMIEHRIKEIHDLLVARFTEFKLNMDSEFNDVDSIAQTEAMDLMERIIAFKETFMSHAGWQALNFNEKQNVYEEQVKEIKALREEKAKLEKKDFSTINQKVGDAARYVPTLRSYSKTLEDKKKEMDLTWEAFNNLKLKVDEGKPEELVKPEEGSVLSYLNPLSYF